MRRRRLRRRDFVEPLLSQSRSIAELVAKYRDLPLGTADTYVRIAGSLSVTLDDLLAGVRWIPGTVEFEFDARYRVEFETSDQAGEGGGSR